MSEQTKHTYPVRIELDDLIRSVDLQRETREEAYARIMAIAEERLEAELRRIEDHALSGGTAETYDRPDEWS